MCARAVENRVGVRCSRAPILILNFYTAYRPAEVCALRTAGGVRSASLEHRVQG